MPYWTDTPTLFRIYSGKVVRLNFPTHRVHCSCNHCNVVFGHIRIKKWCRKYAGALCRSIRLVRLPEIVDRGQGWSGSHQWLDADTVVGCLHEKPVWSDGPDFDATACQHWLSRFVRWGMLNENCLLILKIYVVQWFLRWFAINSVFSLLGLW